MKKTLIFSCILAAAFITAAGCGVKEPTMPEPDLTMTVEAIIGASDSARATETMEAEQALTALALLFTATSTPTATPSATVTRTYTATRTVTVTATMTPTPYEYVLYDNFPGAAGTPPDTSKWEFTLDHATSVVDVSANRMWIHCDDTLVDGYPESVTVTSKFPPNTLAFRGTLDVAFSSYSGSFNLDIYATDGPTTVLLAYAQGIISAATHGISYEVRRLSGSNWLVSTWGGYYTYVFAGVPQLKIVIRTYRTSASLPTSNANVIVQPVYYYY